MKRVAGTEDEPVVGIPAVVGLAIVAVQPQTIVIVLHVEDVQIAVRVAECIVCRLIHCPSITLQAVCRLRHLLMPEHTIPSNFIFEVSA